MTALLESSLSSLPLLARGKVRDLYAVGDDCLLIIATDRISAFDVVLPDPVPGKGHVLTAMTQFWLDRFAGLLPTHATGIDPATVVRPGERDQVQGRAMVVKRLKPILVEAVVRGYLAGSGWADYQASGEICGVALPPGLVQGQQLPQPVFTPAAKAEAGQHDENVSFAHVENLLGAARADEISRVSLQLYAQAAEYARSRGILIADTKFEFGLDDDGVLHLMDEVLTPDSSRFWPQDQHRPGSEPPSFDKQYVRDWLLSQNWDKTPPAPRLPADVLQRTSEKYQDALRRLTVADHAPGQQV